MKTLVVLPSALLVSVHISNMSSNARVRGVSQRDSRIYYRNGDEDYVIRIGAKTDRLKGLRFDKIFITQGVDSELALQKFGHRLAGGSR